MPAKKTSGAHGVRLHINAAMRALQSAAHHLGQAEERNEEANKADQLAIAVRALRSIANTNRDPDDQGDEYMRSIARGALRAMGIEP